jgi:hypothetical protein
MAAVGLLAFARAALPVATQLLPLYRTGFSKHQFAQNVFSDLENTLRRAQPGLGAPR